MNAVSMPAQGSPLKLLESTEKLKMGEECGETANEIRFFVFSAFSSTLIPILTLTRKIFFLKI